MIHHEPATTGADHFTAMEQAALTVVRERFQQDHDRFTARELAQLSFLRWLVRMGHLDS